MIYPKYLKENDTIGITALSCGVLDKIAKYEQAISNFQNKSFNIIETSNVRTNGFVSSDAKTRWDELKSLYENDEVKMINIAAGGNYLLEIFDYIAFNVIKNNIKWIAGSSDPSSLLFTITTNLDIATIYTPCNMTGFGMEKLDKSLDNYFEIIKGNKITQSRSPLYELNEDKNKDGYNLDTKNEWTYINGNVNETGIVIGDCIESIKDIIGTKFDNTKAFLEKYKSEGIIWYFDVFSMSAEELSLTLRQFKYAGWFKYTKAILVSKIKCIPECNELSYEDAIKRSIDDIPIIFNYIYFIIIYFCRTLFQELINTYPDTTHTLY